MRWPQQVLNGSSSAAAAPSSAAKEAEQVDYSTWPIKELRRFLTERGVDASGIVEKADLVAQVTVQALSFGMLLILFDGRGFMASP